MVVILISVLISPVVFSCIIPDRCLGEDGFQCIEVSVANGVVSFIMENNYGDIELMPEFTCSGFCISDGKINSIGSNLSDRIDFMNPVRIKQGDRFLLEVDTGSIGEKWVEVNLSLKYLDLNNNVEKFTYVEIEGKDQGHIEELTETQKAVKRKFWMYITAENSVFVYLIYLIVMIIGFHFILNNFKIFKLDFKKIWRVALIIIGLVVFLPFFIDYFFPNFWYCGYPPPETYFSLFWKSFIYFLGYAAIYSLVSWVMHLKK